MEVQLAARGPLSAALLSALREAPGVPIEPAPVATSRPLADEDLQLALYLCYELHYRGLPGVDDAWEWEPSLLATRGALEGVFLDALRAAVPDEADAPADDIDLALRAIAESDDDPSLSRHLEGRGTA